MAVGEYLAYGSLQADTKVKFSVQVGGHLAPTHIHSSDPSELPDWLWYSDSTTNSIVVL